MSMTERSRAWSNASPTEMLPNQRHERLAAMLVVNPKLTAEQVAKSLKTTEKYATQLLNASHIAKRVHFLQRRRVNYLAGKAIETLTALLDCDDDRVRLGAARDILDRAGIRTVEEQSEHKPTFSVTLNLGERREVAIQSQPDDDQQVTLKTGPSLRPPNPDGEFLTSEESGLPAPHPPRGRASEVAAELDGGEEEDGREIEEAYRKKLAAG